MKKLGKKHTKTKVKGHQVCSACHPETKAGRAIEKKILKKEIENDASTKTSYENENP